MNIVLSVADGLFRQELKTALEIHGHCVRSASNGIEAMLHVKRQLPDVLVMDLDMPLLDGMRTAEDIRNDPKTSRLPIVAIASDDRPETDTGGKIDVVIRVPFRAADLLTAIVRATR